MEEGLHGDLLGGQVLVGGLQDHRAALPLLAQLGLVFDAVVLGQDLGEHLLELADVELRGVVLDVVGLDDL